MALTGHKIPRLTKGPPGLVRILNDLIDRANDVRSFQGDGRHFVFSNVGGSWLLRWTGPPIIAPQPHSTFVVLVWRDGGTTDGDQSTQCDRTYNVRTLEATGPATGGLGLGTGMTPKRVRHTIGKILVAATTGSGVEGTGYYDASGDFQLYDANETLDTGACS